MVTSQVDGEARPTSPRLRRLIALLASPRVRLLLFMVLALLYAACIGYLWLRGIGDLFDFNTYYMAAYAFSHDLDIYTLSGSRWLELAAAAGVEKFSTPFVYPPFVAQLVAPLLRFTPFVAGIIWLILTALAFLFSTWWLGKMWKQPEGASIVYLLMLGFVPPIIAIREGQVGGFLLLALVAALAGLASRKALLVGSALVIASHLKLIPLVLCLYLGWRKQWLAAAAAAVLLVALLLTVPLMFGVDVLESYVSNFAASAKIGQLHPRPANQAISGLLSRALIPRLETATIYQLTLLAAAIVVVVTIVLCWPMRDLPSFWRYEYALIICSLLLILPHTWYHMLTLLLIPLVIVVEQLWRRRHWRLLALIAVMYITTDIHGILYRHVAIPLWLSSFPLFFILLVWGLLAWMLVAERGCISIWLRAVGCGPENHSGSPLAARRSQPSR